MLETQPDLVETVQHAVLGERIDIEFEALTARGGYSLLLEIDRQTIAFRTVYVAKQAIDDFVVEPDHEQPVLEAIVVENIGETGRDDRLKTVLQQRPWRVLARGAAAEVLARQEYRGALVTRLIQDEILVERAFRVIHAGLAVIQVTPFVEKIGPVAGALDRLEILLRDDRVGVDIGAIHRHHQSFPAYEFFHH